MGTNTQTIWTVVHVDNSEGCDAWPWNASYTSKEAAIAAVRKEWDDQYEGEEHEELDELPAGNRYANHPDQVVLGASENWPGEYETIWVLTPTKLG